MKTKHFLVSLLFITSVVVSKAQLITIHHFPAPGLGGVGANFNGGFISNGTFLFGVQSVDGTDGKGYIYKIKKDGTMYDTILNFRGSNGAQPYGSLLSDGTFFYGMTYSGGSSNLGVVYKIKPDGTGYANLHNFTGGTDGSNPSAALVSDGTYLYGMTSTGGVNDWGIIFKVKPDGTGYSKLMDFAGLTNGKTPFGSLFFDGTFLYGMTGNGGTDDLGVLFKIKPDGTGFLKLYDFISGATGALPQGSLISDGTYLYGMTNLGPGTSNYGTVFKIKPDGTGYSEIMTLTGPNGYQTWSDLIYDGVYLYGIAEAGGTYYKGTIFRIKPDGTGYVNMADFSALNGEWPYGYLFFDGIDLFGTTSYGGMYNAGTIYKLSHESMGIKEDESSETISIFPNPATEILNVKIFQAIEKEAMLKITDIMGRVISSQQVNKLQTSVSVDVSALPPGLYFISVANGRKIFVKE